MNKNKTKFSVGNKVFAKLRGYPTWPAIINQIILNDSNSVKYNVIFYGKEDTAMVKEVDLCLFDEYKAIHGKPKKSKEFNFAMKQAELSFLNKSGLLLESSLLNSTSVNVSTDESMTVLASSSPAIGNIPTPKPSTVTKDNAVTNTLATNTPNRLSLCLSLLECKMMTDDCIEMYYDLLSNKLGPSNIQLMNPSLTQSIKIAPHEVDDIVTPLELHNKSLIFFPVSDASALLVEGGAHWSLLLFVRQSQKFYYFDSIGTFNLPHAKQIAARVSKFLGVENKELNIDVLRCPQQTNSVDCGIYTVLFTDVLMQWFLGGSFQASGFSGFTIPEIQESDILTKRAQLALLFHNNKFLEFGKKTISSMMFQGPKSVNIFKDATVSVPNGITVVPKIKCGCCDKAVQDGILCNMCDEGNHFHCVDIIKDKIPNKNIKWQCPKCLKGSNIKFDDGKIEQALIVDKNKSETEVQSRSTVLTPLSSHGNEEEHRLSLPVSNHMNLETKSVGHTSYKQMKTYDIKIFADSQGRNIASNILKKEEGYRVSSLVKPGADFREATTGSCSNTNPESFTVFLAGTNDVARNETHKLLSSLQRNLLLLRDNRVIVCSIPHRHDLPTWSIVNMEVQKANKAMSELCDRFCNTFFVDLSNLGQRFHTKHGMHLNDLGKKYVTCSILKTVNKVLTSDGKVIPPIALEYKPNAFLDHVQKLSQ